MTLTSGLSNFLCKQTSFHFKWWTSFGLAYMEIKMVFQTNFFCIEWINVFFTYSMTLRQAECTTHTRPHGTTWKQNLHQNMLIFYFRSSAKQRSCNLLLEAGKNVTELYLYNEIYSVRYEVNMQGNITWFIRCTAYWKRKEAIRREKKCKDFLFWLIPNTRRKEYMMTSVKDITFLEMPWRWQKMSTICSHNIYTIIKTRPQGLTVSMYASKMTQRQPQCHSA